MIDFRGRQISIGDRVAVLYNAILLDGRVVEEFGGYVKYEVVDTGPGQIRSCHSPHKIAICDED